MIAKQDARMSLAFPQQSPARSEGDKKRQSHNVIVRNLVLFLVCSWFISGLFGHCSFAHICTPLLMPHLSNMSSFVRLGFLSKTFKKKLFSHWVVRQFRYAPLRSHCCLLSFFPVCSVLCRANRLSPKTATLLDGAALRRESTVSWVTFPLQTPENGGPYNECCFHPVMFWK